MNYLGIYYTGTGNSKRVALRAQKELVNRGHTLELVDVIESTEEGTIDVYGYDGLFIFYPIYAFNAPKPIIQYVKRIEKLDEPIPCCIMKQSGEHLFWNNASSLYLISLLKKRNIWVKNEYHYLMPYCFIFRHSDYMAYRMNTVMEGLVPLDLDLFLEDIHVRVGRFPFDSLFAAILRIQWWGGRINGRFYKVDRSKCIKCYKCVKDCPAHNISIKGDGLAFGGKCLMCQRCVIYCPTHAVKAGMFNSWRVDQPYTFKESDDRTTKKPNFCKKNYQRYFAEAELRLNGHKDDAHS